MSVKNIFMKKLKPLLLIILNTLFILSISLNKGHTANYVKVATIGTLVPAQDKTQGWQYVVEQSIKYWEKELEQVLPFKPDLIVLPEACDQPEGLTLEERFEYSRARKNQIQDFFASVAKEHNCYIVFGTKRELNDNTWRNSSIILNRKGEIAGIYDKNFPTIGELESGIIAGNETPVFECDFGTVACAICFDLNFVELRDKYATKKPDIILFSSVYHGGQMQANWAYTCRAFFVGAISTDRVTSEIRDPQGDILATSTNYFDYAVTTINLDTQIAHLDYNWEKLKMLKKNTGIKYL